MFFVSDSELDAILTQDIPYGDLTTLLLGIDQTPGQLTIYPKTDTVISGLTVAQRLFQRVHLSVTTLAMDGDFVSAQTPILKASGPAGAIHATYKTAQNILEYCSGIAHRCAQLHAQATAVNPHCQIVTTRKHFPGTKTLSLMAAYHGKARPHRLGLSDSVLIFDQHRVFLDPTLSEIESLKKTDPERKIAIEANTQEEALRFALLPVDIIQCERFSIESLRKTIKAAHEKNPHLLFSAAGGVCADNARALAATGVDFLVTSWPYFGKPIDFKMQIEAQ